MTLKMDAPLEGLVALVTGAGSGMGLATAQLLARYGATVAVTDVTLDRAEKTTQLILDEGNAAVAWKLDVSSASEIRQIVLDIGEKLGGLDIVINNAGVGTPKAIDAEDYDEFWDWVMTVNLAAHQRIVRAALPFLKASNCARIVNISSTEGLASTSMMSVYDASKAGVLGLTRALACELGSHGITVNAICPGPVETDIVSFVSPEDKIKFAKRRTAIGRYGQPHEVAHMTVSLCMPAASFATGSVVVVDGGVIARGT